MLYFYLNINIVFCMSVIEQENAINSKYDKLKAEIEAKEITKGYTQEDKDKEIAEIEAKEITDEYTEEDKQKELAEIKAKTLIAAYTKEDKQKELAENESKREAELKKVDDDFESKLDSMLNKGSDGFDNDYISTVIENLDFSTPDPVEIDNVTIETTMYSLAQIADNCKYIYLTMPTKYTALNELSETEYNKYASSYDSIVNKYETLKTEIEAKEITKGYTQEDKDKEIAEIEAKEISDEYTEEDKQKELAEIKAKSLIAAYTEEMKQNELSDNETAKDSEIKTLNEEYLNTITEIGVALTALKTDNETGFSGDVHINGKLHVDEDVNLEGKLNNISINDILTQKHLTTINESISKKADSKHEHVTTDVFGLQNWIDDTNDHIEIYGSYIATNRTNIKSNSSKITDIETNIKTINESISTKADLEHNHTISDITDFEQYDDTSLKTSISNIETSLTNKADRNIKIDIKVSAGGSDNAIIFGPLTSMLHFKGYIDILRGNSGSSRTVELEYNPKEKKMYVLNQTIIQGGNMGTNISWGHKYPFEIRLYNDEPFLLYHQYSCLSWLGNGVQFVGIGNISSDNFKIVAQSKLSIPEEETITVVQTTNDQDRITNIETTLSTKADSNHKHTLADIEDFKESETYDDSEIRELIDTKVSEINTTLTNKADLEHNHTLSDITGLNEIITDINGRTTTNETDIAANKTSISQLETDVAYNYSALTDFKTEIDNKVSDIETNIETNINSINESISTKADLEHNHTISDIEDYKSTLLDLIYPVGSIYTSMNNTNPSTFIGGTWKQITDRFLYCSNSSNKTGGSKTISIDNLPSHSHELNQNFELIDIRYSSGGNSLSCYREYSSGGTSIGTDTTSNHTTKSTGKGTEFLPPYITVFAWYRTA